MANVQPAKLAYKVFEPAGGADESLCPVLFLHGLGGSKENWKDIPQIIADKTKRRAYALDARNHGDSEFNDYFDFELNVEDLFHFMDTMNIKKAALVGQSMGGMTSIRAALKKPERIEMLFPEDMYVKKFPKEIVDMVLGMVSMYVAGLQAIPPGLPEKEAVRHLIDIVYEKMPPEHKQMIPKERLLNANLRLRIKPDGTYDASYNKEVVLAALKNSDSMSEPSGQYDGPAYFIYGSLSPFAVGKEEEHIKKHFPNAELIEFEGANHDVHGDCEEKFIDTVLKRLQK